MLQFDMRFLLNFIDCGTKDLDWLFSKINIASELFPNSV